MTWQRINQENISPKEASFEKLKTKDYNRNAYIILITEDASSITTMAYTWPKTAYVRENSNYSTGFCLAYLALTMVNRGTTKIHLHPLPQKWKG